MITAEEVIKRIAAECAFVDDQGGVGIRLKPAAAIVRQYAGQYRVMHTAPARKPRRRAPKGPTLL